MGYFRCIHEHRWYFRTIWFAANNLYLASSRLWTLCQVDDCKIIIVTFAGRENGHRTVRKKLRRELVSRSFTSTLFPGLSAKIITRRGNCQFALRLMWREMHRGAQRVPILLSRVSIFVTYIPTVSLPFSAFSIRKLSVAKFEIAGSCCFSIYCARNNVIFKPNWMSLGRGRPRYVGLNLN